MIKYIINSGGLGANPQKTKDFFNEIVKDLGVEPKIFSFLKSVVLYI